MGLCTFRNMGVFLPFSFAYLLLTQIIAIQPVMGQMQRFGYFTNVESRIIPQDSLLSRRANISSVSRSKGCGYEFFNLQPDLTVVIRSPNFPHLYPPNAYCVWKFQAPFIGQIKIVFTDFLLQVGKNSFTCNNDFLEITDWTGSSRFCANGPSMDELLITSSWVDIRFVSDGMWQYSGCKVIVEFIPSSCGKSWSSTTEYGVFVSPNYPFAYPNDLVCGWIIQVLPERQIRLDCTDLFYLSDSKSSCARDFLAISKSGDVKMKDAVRFCGRDGPGVVISHWNRMVVLFRSDKRNSGIGFRCRFSIISVDDFNVSSRKGLPSCECGNVTQRASRIIGGRRTSGWENPWMVSITDMKGNHLCSGTLIRLFVVLTAGHCVHGLNPEHLRVALSDDLREGVRTDTKRLIQVLEILIYPGYQNQFSDLAMVIMAKYDGSRRAVLPICMPPNGLAFENETAIAVGWHSQESANGIRHSLHQVVIPVLSHSQCEVAYGARTVSAEEMICAGSAGKDACEGDSGGPLTWFSDGKWHIIGIVSFGVGCGLPGFPGVYVRVNHYLDWLRENMGVNSC